MTRLNFIIQELRIRTNNVSLMVFCICFCSLLFNNGLRLEHITGLHSLKILVSIVGSVEVGICLLSWFVDQHVPSCRGDGGKKSCSNKDLLDLLDVHSPHVGLSKLCNCRHEGALNLSLVEVNEANI